VFRPAAALLGRLRFAHKFAVVGLVLVLPLGFVTNAYVDLHQGQIEFSAKERQGVAYLAPLVDLIGEVVTARHLAVTSGPGRTAGVAGAVARLDRVDGRLGTALDATSGWQAAKGLLQAAERSVDAAAAFAAYNRVTAHLLRLIVQVGDRSNLTLDPDLDTYYLMDALQFRLPVLLDQAGRSVDRTLVDRGAAGDRDGPQVEVSLDSGVVASTLAAMDSGLSTALRNTRSAELRRVLPARLRAVDRAVGALLKELTAAVRQGRLAAVAPDAAVLARGESTALAALLAVQLDRLLADRIAALAGSARGIQLLAGGALLLALYLFAGFYRSVTAPIRRMVSVLGAVADGDLDQAVRVDTRDELSFIARALNDTVAKTRMASDRLAHQATHDLLTELPNRALILDRLDHALARMRRGPGQLAVLFVDLDRFKVVNDSMGHDAGDEVLGAAAARIGALVREADTVGRLAGDEFIVICEDLGDVQEALAIAGRLIEALERPIPTHPRGTRPREVIVGASIGIAIARAAAVVTADELLRDADLAMYRAKRLGGGRAELFDDTLRVAIERRVEVEEDLRRAIPGGQLRLHYQPIVDAAAGAVVGFEALVRWLHPRRGLLQPGEFVPVAEESGLVIPLGRWVLAEACRQAAAWRAASGGRAGPYVAVNLSAAQLADPLLLATVAGTLHDAGLDPGTLWLELTETAVMADATAAREVLTQLRALGVHLAIDDFGTGYSSLAHLRRFPVDALKIDRSFIAGLGGDPEDEAIVALVVSLARALGLSVVAEGVETPQQRERVRALGCDTIQGYCIGRPMAPDEAWAAAGAERLDAISGPS